MSKVINKAVVLGAGVMGAGIAALLAGTGVQVALLDIVPPNGLTDEEKAKGLTEDSPAFRNRFAEAGLKNIGNPKGMMLFSKDKLVNIKIGNTTDNLNMMDDADWIIEVVAERLDIKKGVMKQIGEHAGKNTVISSNTSGVSVTKIVEDMPDDFKARFLGTHFFNPPRWMDLFEIVPTKWTKQEVIDRMADFGANALGKTVVYAKDTPNFVGNRIGVYAAVQCMQLTEKYGYDFQTADLITGVIMGHPKSATFKTADMVGLDILANVSKNILQSSTDEVEKANYTLPQYVQELVADGALGDKTKHGFYKKDKVDGKKVIYTWNYMTKQYEEIKAQKFESIAAAKESDNKYEAMAYGQTEECRFYWETLKSAMLYAAQLIPEIADDYKEVDKALRSGFNWEVGVFETWDKLGVKRAAERMQAEGATVPQWVLDRIAAGKNFYEDEGGKSPYIILEKCDVLDENSDASLRDIGDGVLCLEFHSTGNAIGEAVGDIVLKAIDRLNNEDWQGMVIGNNGKNFSAGADLVTIVNLATDKEFDTLDTLIRRLQGATSALKYSPRPVVAAPFAAAYGGGCEVAMHCRGAVPFINTFMGLVEVGVGLIPAGGGCTESVCRAMDRCYVQNKGARFDAIKTVWKNIATAKVNMSAYEAILNGYLDKGTYVEMRRDRLIDSAKEQVLWMAKKGYHPPAEPTIKVMGDYGHGSILCDIEFMRGGGHMSDHDVLISKKIANVICGGNLPYGADIKAQQMLDLEREAFLSLAGTEKTQDRITGMLMNGKPVRN
jgi:3-hydroxyacyl-CoA dehydrogenase